MISTVADFLEQFKDVALKDVLQNQKDVVQAPAIGDIFEGITTSILEQAIFEGLDLRIVEKSFIYNDSGKLSEEMDCMIVVGEGKQVSYTKRYKYHVKDVIAVIQVKKSIYSDTFISSYRNLLSAIEISEPREGERYMSALQRDAYKQLMAREIPTREEIKSLSDRENIIYHFSLMEAFYPLRIAIGYYGYADEYSLREGIISKLEQEAKSGAKKLSPGFFPNLFIIGRNSLVKMNAMPYGIFFPDKEHYWPLLMTSNENPLYYLLQIIWTRLTYKFNLSSEIFGDDHHADGFHPFVWCKEVKVSADSWGWDYQYNYISKWDLKPVLKKEWQPLIASRSQFIILDLLVKIGEIDLLNDSRFKTMIDTQKIDLDNTLRELEMERLIFIEKQKVRLLTDDLRIISFEGKVYAGENKSGEMSTFIKKLMSEHDK